MALVQRLLDKEDHNSGAQYTERRHRKESARERNACGNITCKGRTNEGPGVGEQPPDPEKFTTFVDRRKIRTKCHVDTAAEPVAKPGNHCSDHEAREA